MAELNFKSYLTLVLSLSLILASLIFLILKLPLLPPKVPLFQSLVWGPKRLAPQNSLFILPFLSFLILLLNLSLAETLFHRRENLGGNIFLALSLFVIPLLSLALFRIVNLVTPPTPLIDPTWVDQKLKLLHLDRLGLPFLLALAISLLTTPIIIKLAWRFKIIDDPKTHRHPAILHQKPVPRAGVVPVFLGILAAALIFLPLSKQVIGILLAAFLSTVLGILDDKYDLSPYARFGAQLLIAGCILISGIGATFINNPLGGVVRLDQIDIPLNFFGEHHILLPADLLTIFWIVWVANMISWSNGVDGQFPGVVAITASVIGVLSLRFVSYEPAQWNIAILSFITAGAILGTLPFVWHPAKIFYGFGATVLGVILATLSILTGAKVATAVLILLVPILDALVTIGRRILRGQSPVWGDREHLHHHLLNRGWSHQKTALFYWFLTALCGGLALLTAGKSKALALLTVGGLVGFVLVIINLKGTR